MKVMSVTSIGRLKLETMPKEREIYLMRFSNGEVYQFARSGIFFYSIDCCRTGLSDVFKTLYVIYRRDD